MFRNVFVRLPAYAAVDALQAWSRDRTDPRTKQAIRRAWGPWPTAATVVPGALAAGLSANAWGPAPMVGWISAPSIGTLGFSLFAAWRVRAQNAGGPAQRGMSVGLLPALLGLAAAHLVATWHAPDLASDWRLVGPDGPRHLADALPAITRPVLAGVTQLAWSGALILAGVSARPWLTVPAVVLLGSAAAGGIEVGWALSSLADDLGQPYVLRWTGSFVGPWLDLLHELADVGFAIGVWNSVMAAAWLWLVPRAP